MPISYFFEQALVSTVAYTFYRYHADVNASFGRVLGFDGQAKGLAGGAGAVNSYRLSCASLLALYCWRWAAAIGSAVCIAAPGAEKKGRYRDDQGIYVRENRLSGASAGDEGCCGDHAFPQTHTLYGP